MEHRALADARTLLSLPAEIRMNIFEYVLASNQDITGFGVHRESSSTAINEGYFASRHLQILTVCRQFHFDACAMAYNRTAFAINSLFVANNVPERLASLQPSQFAAIRNISFVADARHFRKLIDWGDRPFGMRQLNLDTLTIVLHSSSLWHYLFDYTSDVTQLLRSLQGVKRFVFVRNNARVKGSFKTWYNRLVGLIMKVDHLERYQKVPPNPEKVWWHWSYDDVGQSFCLEARPSRDLVDEETYLMHMLPLMEEWRESVENEEWNPDPRSRNFYVSLANLVLAILM
jgi:hypothetical protein